MKKIEKIRWVIFRKQKKKKGHLSLIFPLVLLMSLPGAATVFAISDSETVTLSFDIRPATVLKATSSGARGVDIGPVVPGVDAVSEPLEVVINTNTNERYRVYHEVRNRPTSGRGEQFPDDEIKFMAGNGAQGGTSSIPALVSVPNGRTVIFQSGPTGGADRFSLRYTIASKKSFGAGNYYGDIYLDVETA